MRKMKHEGLVREPVIKELDTDMTLNLNIFPYTVLVPKSLQTPRQDGVSAPKNSNCVRWTSLFILFPCACFKASWCHRIASGVSVAQSLSCFHWDGLSDAPERALSMITWPNAHQQHQHRVWYLWVNRNLLSLDDLALQILAWDLGSFKKGWGPGEMEGCLLSTLLGIKVAETLRMSL